ncbi:Protein of unknown function [Pyronema omphalodes CBS 100304]|uniref:Uncharacterized protein n=1 Tax=Pyronema omphalodes (strain CBS 100304) TaxID=1076935 RepID=U4L5Y2_PYROM|nr:Protein of unknown function [Pyronema omphalodes CBS 100304]
MIRPLQLWRRLRHKQPAQTPHPPVGSRGQARSSHSELRTNPTNPTNLGRIYQANDRMYPTFAYICVYPPRKYRNNSNAR